MADERPPPAWRSHPNWTLVDRVIGEVLPGARNTEPDHLFELFRPTLAPLPPDSPDPWALIKPHVPPLTGLVFIASHASYPTLGPFITSADRLDDLMSTSTNGGAVFDLDVTIIAPSEGVVVVHHHEDYFTVLMGERVPGFAYR